MSTPRDKGALTGEVKHFPAPRPGGDEYTVRTHEEELPVPSEGEINEVHTVGVIKKFPFRFCSTAVQCSSANHCVYVGQTFRSVLFFVPFRRTPVYAPFRLNRRLKHVLKQRKRFREVLRAIDF